MVLNYLSLCDGISSGQLALNQLGIKKYKYYSSEIDKYAIAVTQHHYPSTIQLGNILAWKTWDIDWSTIDIVTAGFPCQSWSMAGKQLGDKDPRGKIFWYVLDIISHVLKHNPKAKLMLENVRMKKDFEEYITYHTQLALGHVEKILINSSLVSAQNRLRFYWSNFKITPPEDKKIYLVDIIESGLVDRDKSYWLDANYFKGGNIKSYFEKHRRQLIFSKDELCHVANADIKGHDSIKRVYHPNGKAPTLTTMMGGHREPKILCGAWRGRYVVDKTRQDSKQLTKGVTTQRLEVRQDEKTNTLTTVQKDNNIVDVNNLLWRKLTPLECERLQTLPDNYTLVPYGKRLMSNTQRYKMIGNSWTIDVIKHIFNHINNI